MNLLTLRNSDTGQVLGILGLFSKPSLLEKAAKESNEQAIKSCRFIHDQDKIKPLSWQDDDNGQRTARAYQGNGLEFHSMPMIVDAGVGGSNGNKSQIEIPLEQIFNLFPALAQMKQELDELGCPVEIKGHEDTERTSVFINIDGDHPILDHLIDHLKENGYTTTER